MLPWRLQKSEIYHSSKDNGTKDLVVFLHFGFKLTKK